MQLVSKRINAPRLSLLFPVNQEAIILLKHPSNRTENELQFLDFYLSEFNTLGAIRKKVASENYKTILKELRIENYKKNDSFHFTISEQGKTVYFISKGSVAILIPRERSEEVKAKKNKVIVLTMKEFITKNSIISFLLLIIFF